MGVTPPEGIGDEGDEQTTVDPPLELGSPAAERSVDDITTQRKGAHAPVARGFELEPGTQVGEYRIEGKLGEGGMGAVYGAVHPLIGKRAAIKVLRRELCADAETVERFVQEARAVNQIGHPNIVDVFAFGALPDGRSYFAMEWLKGESLAVRRLRSMTLAESVYVLSEVAVALEAAHDKGIIHRDLKPDNVFLVEVRGARPVVKLLDFGIAKLTNNEDTRLERTRTGAMIGTPMYIAPEQARGYAIDASVDVYSLGAMAFQLLTGRPPFLADNAMDMVSLHLHEPPPRASTVNPELPAVADELLAAMMAKDARRRPSLAAVRVGLAAIAAAPPRAAVDRVALDTTAEMATAAAPTVARAPRGGRRWLAAGLIGAIAVGAGVFVAIRAARHTEASPPPPAPAMRAPTPAPPAPTPPAPVPAPVVTSVVASVGSGSSAPQTASTATLEVSVTGASAATAHITVDQHLTATAPAQLELAPGAHTIVVDAPGFVSETRTVELVAGERTPLAIALRRASGRSHGGNQPPSPPANSGSAAGPTTISTTPGTGSAAAPPAPTPTPSAGSSSGSDDDDSLAVPKPKGHGSP